MVCEQYTYGLRTVHLCSVNSTLMSVNSTPLLSGRGAVGYGLRPPWTGNSSFSAPPTHPPTPGQVAIAGSGKHHFTLRSTHSFTHWGTWGGYGGVLCMYSLTLQRSWATGPNNYNYGWSYSFLLPRPDSTVELFPIKNIFFNALLFYFVWLWNRGFEVVLARLVGRTAWSRKARKKAESL